MGFNDDPPSVKPDEPKEPETPSETERYDELIANNAGWKPYGSLIRKLAKDNYISPLEFLSVLIFAFGLNPPATGAANTFGLVATRMGATRQPKKLTLTEWFRKQWDNAWGVPKGNIDTGGPEAIFQGATPTQPTRPKPPKPTPTPAQVAARGAAITAARTDIENPEVRLDANGNYIDPSNKKAWNKGKPITIEGLPGNVRTQEWFQAKRQWGEFFRAYGQKEVSDKMLTRIIRDGLSEFTVSRWLAGNTTTPAGMKRRQAFMRSAVWKSSGVGYKALWQDVFGRNTTPDNDFIARAVLNNWDDQTFVAQARDRDDWINSATHQQEATTLRGVYEQIYGRPDQNGVLSINEAALAGWTPDQFATWLRGQPSYSRSVEYTKKVDSLSEMLGFVTGVRPAGLVDAPLRQTDPTVPLLPDDPRYRGQPHLSAQSRAPTPTPTGTV